MPMILFLALEWWQFKMLKMPLFLRFSRFFNLRFLHNYWHDLLLQGLILKLLKCGWIFEKKSIDFVPSSGILMDEKITKILTDLGYKIYVFAFFFPFFPSRCPSNAFVSLQKPSTSSLLFVFQIHKICFIHKNRKPDRTKVAKNASSMDMSRYPYASL